MLPLGVFILGPAGVGKTSIVKKLIDITRENQLNCKAINLDPGCTQVVFDNIFDVREISNTQKIIEENNFGPNYAMIESFNNVLNQRKKIFNKIRNLETDIIYFDTPGQMEVFLFNAKTPLFLNEINKYIKPIGVFVLDNEMVKNIRKMIVTEFLTISFEMHLSLPLITVINKSDLGIPDDTDLLIKDTKYLIDKLKKSKMGIEKDLILGIIPQLREIRGVTRVVYTSIRKGEGFNDLFNLIHEAFCVCGDLT